MRQLRSYCCVVFHCRGNPREYASVYVCRRMLHSFCQVFIISCHVSIPFRACIGCSELSVLHSPSLYFLFHIQFFLSPFVTALASGGSADTGSSSSAGHSRYTCTASPFMVGRFMSKNGANFDSGRLAAMRINGDSACIWDVCFWHSCHIVACT